MTLPDYCQASGDTIFFKPKRKFRGICSFLLFTHTPSFSFNNKVTENVEQLPHILWDIKNSALLVPTNYHPFPGPTFCNVLV